MGDGKNPADGRYSVDVEAMSFTQDIASQSRCVQSSDKRLTDRFSYGYSNMAVNQNLSCGVSKHVDLQSKKDEVMICCGKPQKRAL